MKTLIWLISQILLVLALFALVERNDTTRAVYLLLGALCATNLRISLNEKAAALAAKTEGGV